MQDCKTFVIFFGGASLIMGHGTLPRFKRTLISEGPVFVVVCLYHILNRLNLVVFPDLLRYFHF